MAAARAAGSDRTLETPNRVRQQKINADSLPLHCPLPGASLWDSHPRVFLPIEDAPDGRIRCPYCGTLYILQRSADS